LPHSSLVAPRIFGLGLKEGELSKVALVGIDTDDSESSKGLGDTDELHD